MCVFVFFFFSSRRRHTRCALVTWSSDVCSSDLACASTGGVLMPPVMGATAFVMASFLEMPYAEIAIAAAIPSLLFYLGLFLQIDAYAARNNLDGDRKSTRLNSSH